MMITTNNPRSRKRGWVAALVLAVAGSGLAAAGAGLTVAGLTVAGAAATASAGTIPVATSGGGGSCTLMPDQTVWCWGSNATGQLGNGSLASSLVPVKSAIPAAINVSAGQSNHAIGQNHTCAVDPAHLVWCWGSNAYGELGNGTTSQDSNVPVQAQGVLASQVSAGDQFSCAVTLAHTVNCWGDNNFGELGNGTFADSSTPVKVKNLTNVTQVAAGYFHACARESNGTMWCWGDDSNGQLGNGAPPGSGSNKPVQVRIQNVTSIAAGADDTCAIGNAPGDLLCWGVNNDGQLGTGNFTDQNVPTQVASLSTGVQQVSMGIDFTCAIAGIPGPAALCWGDNGGQLGNGTFDQPPSDPFPSQVFGLMTAPAGGPGGMPQQIAVGSEHACVVMSTAVVKCWGAGSWGRLGNGDELPRDLPTPVIGLPLPAGSANAVTAGYTTGCAVTSGLSADCWGQFVGDGSSLTTIHTAATPVANVTPGSVSQVSAAWGGCALVRTGGLATEVRCWGDNTNGQLGTGNTNAPTKAVKVKGLSNGVEAVSAGGSYNCALVHNGGVQCWGYNGYGQLGNGSTTSSLTPVAVSGLPNNVAAVGTGFEHACAVLTDGTVQCWGHNNHGQLGNGSTSDSNTPVPVTGLAGVAQIAVADSATCALTSAGSVECWGDNIEGELGNGSTSDSNVPVQVSGLTGGVVSLAAADGTICAALFTGQVNCWGDNTYGELGTGSVGSPASSDTPVTVSGFTSNGSVGISAGGGSTACALSVTQQAFCWGDNSVGELGDGTSGAATDSGTPVAVQGL